MESIVLEDTAVRFTEDGKIYVTDALSALGETEAGTDLWDALLREKPEIVEFVEYCRHGGGTVPVADSETWDDILTLVFDYLIEVSARPSENRGINNG